MNKKTKKINSYEKIVTESLKLFSLKGFNNTSISDILDATNMSKGGFYNHFKSKEELFTSVLNEAQSVWRIQILDGLDKVDRNIDKVKRILENYRDRYFKDAVHFPGGCLFTTLSIELDNHLPQLSSQLRGGFKKTKALIRRFLDRAQEKGEIRSDISTSYISEILFSSILGTSVVYSMNKSQSQVNKNIESLIQYLESIENKA